MFVMIKLFYCIGTLTLLLVAWPCPAYNEPYSPACESAVETVIKARETLIPYQRSLELAQARERGAYAELAVCTGGGIFSVTKAFACNDASWQAPQRTKDVIAAEDAYLQGRKDFEELFEQARRVCLIDP
jgi:hypothetical protein